MDAKLREGLEPFVTAQDPVWDSVQAELEAGRKETHWMWFIFPQLRRLGHSETAQFYGIEDLAEAKAYAAHPVLGDRLVRAASLVLAHPDRTAEAILGPVDGAKLRSCATLFDVATENPTFAAILGTFYRMPCPLTLNALGR